MQGKLPVRCRILFDHLKVNADEMKNVSKELVIFYKVAESQFVTMNKSKGQLQFVGKWKEYLSIDKMSLLSNLMQSLGPFANELIEHEL